MRFLRNLVVTAAGLALLAGCGPGGITLGAPQTSAAPPSGTTAGGSDAAACAAVADINRLDDSIQGDVSAAVVPLASGTPSQADVERSVADLRDVISRIEADAPQLYAAYDRLKEGAPADVVADIDAAKAVTGELVTELKKVQSSDDLQTFVQSVQNNPGLRNGAQAVLRLDSYTRDRCGVGIAD